MTKQIQVRLKNSSDWEDYEISNPGVEDIRIVDELECEQGICKERGWHYYHTHKGGETTCLTCDKKLDECKPKKKIEKLDKSITAHADIAPVLVTRELVNKINELVEASWK